MKKIILIVIINIYYFYCYSQQTDDFIDLRDGNIYKTIKIGNQWWFAENLAYQPEIGNYWVYNNDTSFLKKCGYLYDIKTAKNVCPSGWHLPKKKEFEKLIKNVGGTGLKAYESLISGGSSGFNAEFVGYRSYDENQKDLFFCIDTSANYWSSSSDLFAGYFLNVRHTCAFVYETYKKIGLSVRCVKD